MYWGHFGIGPCGCRIGIQSDCIIVVTVCNDMFDHMDGVMQALAKKMTQWKEDLFFTVKVARQRLSKYYTEVAPTTGMHLISARILDPFRKLRSICQWGKRIHVSPEHETSCPTQYQEALPKYVEDEYCAKHRSVTVYKLETVPSINFVPSAQAAGYYQLCFYPYDSSRNDEEYSTPNNVAETTPRRSDCAARLFTAARLYLSWPPEAPKTWGQINLNLNDYHSDPIERSSTFWIVDITDLWRQ